MNLMELIEGRSAKIAVIGLGYVGVPLAMEAAGAGFHVIGIDSDDAKVAQLAAGTADVAGVDGSDIAGIIATGRFVPTTDPSTLKDADVIVICVPTPLKDGTPDMSYVEQSGRTIATHLRSGQLVILESTTYPGTTEELLFTILETSGLKAGYDFLLGFSPERIDPGNQKFGIKNVPKIVGGLNEASTEAMASFYGAFIDSVVKVSSPRTAEMAKLLENTYRHVNIALVNEMAILCHDLGIDVWEVIDAAATKPFGFHAFYPGPGWGGHCIPVDPAYLSWRVRQMGATARFVELAREFNEQMPAYVVMRMVEALNNKGQSLKGSRILVLGVAYKSDVADLRESPALEIIEKLRKGGAVVSFNDPLIGRISLKAGDLSSVAITDEVLSGSDLVVIHTAHSGYDWERIAEKAKLVLDTRNVIGAKHDHVVKL